MSQLVTRQGLALALHVYAPPLSRQSDRSQLHAILILFKMQKFYSLNRPVNHLGFIIHLMCTIDHPSNM